MLNEFYFVYLHFSFRSFWFLNIYLFNEIREKGKRRGTTNIFGESSPKTTREKKEVLFTRQCVGIVSRKCVYCWEISFAAYFLCVLYERFPRGHSDRRTLERKKAYKIDTEEGKRMKWEPKNKKEKRRRRNKMQRSFREWVL